MLAGAVFAATALMDCRFVLGNVHALDTNDLSNRLYSHLPKEEGHYGLGFFYLEVPNSGECSWKLEDDSYGVGDKYDLCLFGDYLDFLDGREWTIGRVMSVVTAVLAGVDPGRPISSGRGKLPRHPCNTGWCRPRGRWCRAPRGSAAPLP